MNNNRASYSGGAFHFYHAQILLEGEIIGLGNQAQEYYGGWLYTFECTMTILGKMILKRNSGKGGAALHGEKSTLILFYNPDRWHLWEM